MRIIGTLAAHLHSQQTIRTHQAQPSTPSQSERLNAHTGTEVTDPHAPTAVRYPPRGLPTGAAQRGSSLGCASAQQTW